MKRGTDKTVRILVAAVLPLLGVQLASAASISWNNASSANWNLATNWTGGASFPGNTDDAIVNLDGTYTVTGNLTGSANTFNSVTIGTAGTVGIATVSGNNNFSFKNMTVGSRGIFIQAGNLILGGAAGDTLTVQTGGTFKSNGTNTSANLGGHNVAINSGGSWELNGLNTTPSSGTTLTIDGSVTGTGNLNLTTGTTTFAGSGTIGGAGSIVGSATTTRTNNISDNLTVTRPWTDNVNLIAFVANGLNTTPSITLNGSYSMDRSNSQTASLNASIFANTTATSATVHGTGAITITNSYTGATAASLPFGGNGDLTIDTTGDVGSLTFLNTGNYNTRFASTNLNLQRDTTLTRTSAGLFEQALGNTINVSGSGVTMTMGNTVVVRPAIVTLPTVDTARAINVNGSAELRMSGATIQANSAGADWNLRVGQTTAGSLTLTAGTTNRLETYTTGGTGQMPGNMFARFDSNAIINAEAGSKLALNGASVRVDMTSAANWGLKSAGEINIAGSNVTLEALSDDLGNTVTVAARPFALNKLSFTDSGSDAALTLWENTNNDGGAADVALYVQTLDLSGLNAGRVLALTGLADGRVYYDTIVNPNSVSFDNAQWVQIVVPEPASLSALGLGLGSLLIRRRR